VIDPDCGCKAEFDMDAFGSFGGSGLFLESLRAVVEEEGVATGD
jgi:hypothetical protein